MPFLHYTKHTNRAKKSILHKFPAKFFSFFSVRAERVLFCVGGVGFSFFYSSRYNNDARAGEKCKFYGNRKKRRDDEKNRKIISIKRGLLSKRYSLNRAAESRWERDNYFTPQQLLLSAEFWERETMENFDSQSFFKFVQFSDGSWRKFTVDITWLIM